MLDGPAAEAARAAIDAIAATLADSLPTGDNPTAGTLARHSALDSGRAGLALFYAYLARSTGDRAAGTGSRAGAGGSVDAYGRVNPKEYAAVAKLSDIHFDFDSYEIRPEAAKILEASAEWLKANPKHLVLIEGHADERGTAEYNIALGDRRARAALNYLVSHGWQARRVTRISYGEERAICKQQTEECWAKNRRAHFAVKSQ